MAADRDDELEFELEPDEEETYVHYDIASYPSDHTLAGILDLWKAGDIVIPDFQREFVWTIKQSSLLIESFLLGLPVPPVFFYIDKDNKNLVIDGQQRIVSIVYYLDGYFGDETQGKRQVFRLTGISPRSPYVNLRFEDLQEADQRKLKNSVLRAVNIRQLSPSTDNTSVFHIFERLNTGGTPLKPQEIRNCVYRGAIIQVLREVNADKSWRRILGKNNFDKHQRDVELVLRLLALFEGWKTYEKPMKDYLSNYMDKNRRFDTTRNRRFREIFPKACEFIVTKLGAKPFHVNGPLNTSVLDSVMGVVMEHIDHLPKNFDERFRRLITNKEFLARTKGATTDTLAVQERFKLALEALTG